MVAAESFVAELEAKNEASFAPLVATYVQGLGQEGLSPADLLRLELKSVVEATEVAALWLVDCDSLEDKMGLGEQCGDGAKHYRAIGERLTSLGVDLASFDPRSGGYSKMFAFLRSLGTTEERASAGALTLRASSAHRLQALAALCDQKGDAETGRLLRDVLCNDELRHVTAGRRSLIASATAEESQARARRAAFRTIETLGEILVPATARKYLTRSLKK